MEYRKGFSAVVIIQIKWMWIKLQALRLINSRSYSGLGFGITSGIWSRTPQMRITLCRLHFAAGLSWNNQFCIVSARQGSFYRRNACYCTFQSPLAFLVQWIPKQLHIGALCCEISINVAYSLLKRTIHAGDCLMRTQTAAEGSHFCTGRTWVSRADCIYLFEKRPCRPLDTRTV